LLAFFRSQRVHFASNNAPRLSDLLLSGASFSVPVRDHSSVVLPDHSDARPDLAADLRRGMPSYTRNVMKLERRSRGLLPTGARPV
jgi:hypothetical protein